MHEGLPRAFDLTKWSYFLDFALVPVVAGALAGYSDLTAGSAIAFWIGAAVWTLAEYWIHRVVFHGKTRLQPMHDMHHRLPRDMIGAASWLTFAGFGLVWLIAWGVVGSLAHAFTAGFMLGYLFYCGIHVRMHHGNRAAFGRYISFMFEHHAGHHRGGRGNFGVSSPIWDFVFSTYRKA